jgi:hypothetical protein
MERFKTFYTSGATDFIDDFIAEYDDEDKIKELTKKIYQ